MDIEGILDEVQLFGNVFFRCCEEKQYMVLMIVSGCLGLGKFVVLCVLEDMGFYCVDNFFVVLLFDLV